MRANLRPIVLAALVAGASLATAGAGSAQAQTAAPPSDNGVLVHRFTLPAKQSWGTISIALSPASWRVGHADGPPASETQLRAALGNLAGVELGGRCAGWVEGPTSYPCAFAVRELDFAGNVADRYAAIVNDSTAADPARAAAAVASRPRGIEGSGLIAPVPDSARFVGLHAPLRYLGDKERTFGGRLRFEMRAVSNPLVPSEFERDSGLVMLRAGPARQL
jgi:hypothetical protein